jgi:two-component system, response regulator PdtaR
VYPVILVVEDEPIVRLYECDVAEEAGFLALGAFNAADALMDLEGSAKIDCVLTDVSMPGDLDGFALAETVRERWPEVKVIVTSGHPENADKATDRGWAFVPKPFTPDQLISALAA